MRKLVGSVVVSGLFGMTTLLHATTIDTKSVQVSFIGYKTPIMADLEGSFKQIQYTFGKDSKTLVGTLQNARAIIVPTSSEIPDNTEATQNMNKVFFPILVGRNNIEVTFIRVIEGEDVGIISAKVTIGKNSAIIPLHYVIKDTKLTAKGVLDLNNFSNANKALQALSAAAVGHGGTTWPNVDVVFSADVVR